MLGSEEWPGQEGRTVCILQLYFIGEFLSLFCLLLCIYFAMNEFECVCVCVLELSVQSFVFAGAKLDAFELMYSLFQGYL